MAWVNYKETVQLAYSTYKISKLALASLGGPQTITTGKRRNL
jgi:hypothetical protein